MSSENQFTNNQKESAKCKSRYNSLGPCESDIKEQNEKALKRYTNSPKFTDIDKNNLSQQKVHKSSVKNTSNYGSVNVSKQSKKSIFTFHKEVTNEPYIKVKIYYIFI